MSSNLTHIIYASSAAADFGPSDIDSMLRKARVDNAARGITGLLLYSAGSFIQVIEGDDAALSQLYVRIAADPRHIRVTRIIQEPIARRAFGEWSMGLGAVDGGEPGAAEAFRDVFEDGDAMADIPPGRAKKLLHAFADGRWRARISGEGH